jgi:Glycosyltransferase family 87
MMAHKARAVVLSFLLAGGMVGYYFRIFLPRARATRAAHKITFIYGEDFYPYWFGTHELMTHRLSPYGEQATRQIQTSLYGRVLHAQNPYERDQHRFSYPLYVTLLLAPVAWFSFDVARVGAAVILPVFVVLGILFWNAALRVKLSHAQLAIVTILSLSTYSLLDALVTQQLTLLVFVALSLGIWFLAQRQFWFSGLALAISTIKPQLVIVPILFLLLWSLSRWQERQNLLRSLVFSITILVALSMWLLPTWPLEWWHTIVSYRQYTVPPLASYLLGRLAGNLLTSFLMLSAAWFGWKARHDEPTSERFALTFAFTLAVSVVTIPMGNAVYDHILIIPAVLLLLSKWQLVRTRTVKNRLLLWTCVAVFAWQWITGTLVFLSEFFWPGLIRSAVILSAPLRTQPSMPFAVIALLGLTMAHSFRGTQQKLVPQNAFQNSSSNFND